MDAVLDGLPDADHHAVLGEHPVLHGPDLLVPPVVEILADPALGEQLPVVGLLVAGDDVRAGLPQLGEVLMWDRAGGCHDRQSDLVVYGTDDVQEFLVAVADHERVLAHGQVGEVDPRGFDALGEVYDLVLGLPVPLDAVGVAIIAERAVVPAIGAEIDESVEEGPLPELPVADPPGALEDGFAVSSLRGDERRELGVCRLLSGGQPFCNLRNVHVIHQLWTNHHYMPINNQQSEGACVLYVGCRASMDDASRHGVPEEGTDRYRERIRTDSWRRVRHPRRS